MSLRKLLFINIILFLTVVFLGAAGHGTYMPFAIFYGWFSIPFFIFGGKFLFTFAVFFFFLESLLITLKNTAIKQIIIVHLIGSVIAILAAIQDFSNENIFIDLIGILIALIYLFFLRRSLLICDAYKRKQSKDKTG